MRPAQTRALVEVLHEIFSTGATKRLKDVLTADFICHVPRGWKSPDVVGPDGIDQAILDHRKAFPDWTEVVLDLIVEGDRAASRFTATATHLGPFLGLPATGRFVWIDEMAMFRLGCGRIAEQWFLSDDRALENQLAAR